MSSSTFTFVIDAPTARQGMMVYDLPADEWVISNADHVAVGRIDANTFKSIREFKDWARDALENDSA